MRSRVVVFIASLTTASLFAQAPRPAFETASVKPNPADRQTVRPYIQRPPGGHFTAINQTLFTLVSFAYAVPAYRMVGLPEWGRTERFDVVARAPEGMPPAPPQSGDVTMQMLQTLLENRFRLLIREEIREGPVYHLVVARSDGRLGPQLRKSTVDCGPILAKRAQQRVANGGVAVAAGIVDGTPVCGAVGGGAAIRGSGVQLTALLGMLSQNLQAPVEDRTGLIGPFDYELTFQPGAAPAGSPLADRPMLPTALQDQLGLKLEQARGPVSVMVIQSVERPTEN